MVLDHLSPTGAIEFDLQILKKLKKSKSSNFDQQIRSFEVLDRFSMNRNPKKPYVRPVFEIMILKTKPK